MLFCGLTHPEAIAAGRQRILEPMSEKLSKFGMSQAPICWQADLLWFASLMTGRLAVKGAVLFCGLTHPEARAAARQRILEPLSEKLSKFGVSQAPICSEVLCCSAVNPTQKRHLPEDRENGQRAA